MSITGEPDGPPIRPGASLGDIAAGFHNTLAAMILEVARLAKVPRVVLTGGCFQNRVLMEKAVTLLEGSGFRPYWHQRIPPNDGGISVGQLIGAASPLNLKH